MSSDFESMALDQFSIYREFYQLKDTDFKKFLRLFCIHSFQRFALLYLISLVYFNYSAIVSSIFMEIFGECFIYLYLVHHLHEERRKNLIENEYI